MKADTRSKLERWVDGRVILRSGDRRALAIEGAEHLLEIGHQYLDSIRGKNSPPDYTWNKECHGVIAVLNYLENYCGRIT